ncbi:kinesin-like protein KIN-7F [Brassica napus]|uniref:kinesin-like protein KIN-7F n=1 Tax=Brassica napus TaxID=3708 RepID=UPI0006AB6573|nr:kinesin-like protein KIN-7F [Brassica napus]XP_022544039.1 kinesin-like protein KIN-7F [Brassica napus]
MSHASKCDCAITVRKKDVQIQKMEKKMAKLRKQRDIAESRLEDFMRIIEHHHQALKSGTPYFGNHTDKWEDDGSVSDTSGMVNLLDTRSFISDDDDDDDINEELPMRSQDPSDEYCREVQCIEIEETATVFSNNNPKDEKEETKNVVGHNEDHADDERSVVQNVNHRDTIPGAERQESHKIEFPELELVSSSVSRSDSMSSSYGSNSNGIPTPLGEEGGISTFQTFVDGLKEMSKRHQEVSNAEASGKMEKDLGVDGDFERKRQEILELWQSCNASLVRRTYFYLLFKGDEADSVYIGVELRRLLFIKDRFSQGKQASDGGETLTLSSSLKALHKERKMLSKLVRKRFSEEEMTRIYHKFGIAVNSKRRRLQLVNKLWSNPKDMTQVAESADVVSKLVKLTEQGKAMKEMFGLASTSPSLLTSQKAHGWRKSLPPLF